MENLWSDDEARATVARYAEAGVSEDLALRVYSTRLLGEEARLVEHGGGNTSVKTTMPDLLGDEVEALCVKGSGRDMARIEPRDLPALRLEPLRALLARDSLGDEAMVNALRLSLLDSAAPNPSVEALSHAFLPPKYIDHTHAAAVLALTDQPNGEALVGEVYGARAAAVPFVMHGFALAKRAHEVFSANPGIEGLILLKHGIFTFGDTAEQAYARMIDLVTLAEERIRRAGRKVFAVAKLPKLASVAEVAPILRGIASLDADQGRKRWILDFRGNAEVRNYASGAEVERYARIGVATPDHAIRTKGKPLIVPAPEAGKLDAWRAAAAEAAEAFRREYEAYFERNNARYAPPKTPLDSAPRVVLVPGLGLFGLGRSAAEARIAADLAETTVEVVSDAEALGTFTSIDEEHLFDVEYWSLEQAKLEAAEKPLARQVVVVTGGGGAIGAATARAFAAEGAEVAVLDVDGETAEWTADAIDGLPLACDVTDARAVRAAFDAVCESYGGVDIVVSNAGAAWQGPIGEVRDEVLRKSFDLNFFAHQYVAQNAVRVMCAQGTGGVLLFNVSKQAINPGRDFGPYGLPKAATLLLSRQYALEYGSVGIRSNAVNADRVRSGILTEAMIAERAEAREVSEDEYMSGNLLGCEVTAEDVARAFVALALAPKTTGAVLTVDGGNIAAALR